LGTLGANKHVFIKQKIDRILLSYLSTTKYIPFQVASPHLTSHHQTLIFPTDLPHCRQQYLTYLTPCQLLSHESDQAGGNKPTDLNSRPAWPEAVAVHTIQLAEVSTLPKISNVEKHHTQFALSPVHLEMTNQAAAHSFGNRQAPHLQKNLVIILQTRHVVSSTEETTPENTHLVSGLNPHHAPTYSILNVVVVYICGFGRQRLHPWRNAELDDQQVCILESTQPSVTHTHHQKSLIRPTYTCIFPAQYHVCPAGVLLTRRGRFTSGSNGFPCKHDTRVKCSPRIVQGSDV